MSRNAKILIDLAVLAAVYGIWLLPKWRPLGRRTLTVYTLMYGCLASIALFTLMPVLAALPFCFDHPYVPMHMAPFEDVILRHGDYVRQIVLNIALFVPFGVLLPLCTMGFSLAIVDAVSPSVSVGGLLRLSRKCTTWILGLLMTVFLGVLSMQNWLGSSVDTAASKTTKYVIANFVPVVGSAVSDAYTTVRSSLQMLHNS